MKTFIAFVKKELLHIIRDFRTMTVLIGMPVIQVILFGFAIRTEVNDAEIAILDLSKDQTSIEITNKILSSGYFKLNGYLNSVNEIESQFRQGKADEVIVFGRNFGQNLQKEGSADLQIILDASNPNLASLLAGYTKSILNDYLAERSGQMKSAQPFSAEIRMIFNEEMESVFMFVPGLIAFILLLVTALMTSIAITREKELGTMETLLASPLPPPVIIFGKVVPYIAMALFNAFSVLMIAIIVFGIPFEGSPFLLALEIFLFILTALSLGIFISTVAKTQQVAMMMSLAVLMMPTMLLSGFIFPIENMPYILRLVSNIIPATWFLIIEKGIMLKGLGIADLWQETLILVFMTVFFSIASIKNFKIRLDK